MYSPLVKPELVQRLWMLKQRTKKAITRMVDEAIRDYLERQQDRPGNPTESPAFAAGKEDKNAG